jgi:hypothetical protein
MRLLTANDIEDEDDDEDEDDRRTKSIRGGIAREELSTPERSAPG